MKDATPKTIYLKEYTPPTYLINNVDIEFQLGEEETRVVSVLELERNQQSSAGQPLVLNGEQLKLVSLKLDDTELGSSEYDLTENELTIHSVPDKAKLEVITRIRPQENTSLEGLYKSSGNFCTQCEAEGFRKITYYLDRPDVMANFTVVIIADKEKYPALLSNGNPVDSGDYDDGRHWIKWHDPFKKPCYLFALVAGDLAFIEDHFKTMSGRNIQLRIYVQHHNIDQCEHAMCSLKKSMQWDEETYGREYDLDVYNIVAVDDFNMGAMENKGLNIFNSKCVLARQETATDMDFINIEGVIAHEYFHNWSGNRVTCRDWFQLTLKEGLTVFRDQQFTSDMNAATPKRIDDVNVLRTSQFAEDAGPMSHPIQPDSYQEINNFYTVTVYNKGAEVIRMIHTLLGKEGFRKGMDLYFKRHDGRAVTTEEFVCAMEEASNISLAQFRYWYKQSGTPVITVEEAYDVSNQSYSLTIKQSTPATPCQEIKRPFHMPIVTGLLDQNGNDMEVKLGDLGETKKSHILHIEHEQQQFIFHGVKEKPVLSILRGFSAPVKVVFDRPDEELAFCMGKDNDDFNRWDAGQQLATRIILRMIDDIRNDKQPQLPDYYIEACKQILLDKNLDRDFVARSLTLPSHVYIAEMMEQIDVDAIHTAREYIHQVIADELKNHWLAVYEQNYTQKYEQTPEAMGQHFLKNLALFYLMYTQGDESEQLALRQFRQANNMTDQQAAFRALVHNECQTSNRIIDDFYQQWQHDQLVMDKWFMIQATAVKPSTLSCVTELFAHRDFDLKNPNRVRSLLGAFCVANPVCFHDKQGEGYQLLGKYVEKLNSLNPQMAARLIIPMTRWQQYDEIRSRLMLKELNRLLQLSDLSSDVYELVAKSLAQSEI